MGHKISLCLLLVVFLVGCAATVPSETSAPTAATTAEATTPPETAVPATSAPPETIPEESNPVPAGAQALEEQSLLWYDQMFGDIYDKYAHHPRNWYNCALAVTFSSMEDMDFYDFFYNGMIPSEPVTEAETAYLIKNRGFIEGQQIQKYPAEVITQILDQYFGLDLADTDLEQYHFAYWKKTDCYYTCHSDSIGVWDIHFTAGYYTPEDGTVTLFYYNDYFDADYVITIQSRKNEGLTGYKLLSNLPAE